MSRLGNNSRERYPGETLELTQMFVLGVATVGFAFALMCKSFPANAGLAEQIARNYGANVFMLPPLACALLMIAQTIGKRVPRTRRLGSVMIWVVPTLWLGLGSFLEADQYTKAHGDWRDFVALALGWALTVAPLTWADRTDRRRALVPAIQPS